MEDSASGFSVDECTDNSHVTGGYYSHTVCGATRVDEGTSSCSSVSIIRTSIGVQATPYLKTTGVQYKSHRVKNKLVQIGRYTSDRAMQAKTAVTSKFCQIVDGKATLIIHF